MSFVKLLVQHALSVEELMCFWQNLVWVCVVLSWAKKDWKKIKKHRRKSKRASSFHSVIVYQYRLYFLMCWPSRNYIKIQACGYDGVSIMIGFNNRIFDPRLHYPSWIYPTLGVYFNRVG